MNKEEQKIDFIADVSLVTGSEIDSSFDKIQTRNNNQLFSSIQEKLDLLEIKVNKREMEIDELKLKILYILLNSANNVVNTMLKKWKKTKICLFLIFIVIIYF